MERLKIPKVSISIGSREEFNVCIYVLNDVVVFITPSFQGNDTTYNTKYRSLALKWLLETYLANLGASRDLACQDLEISLGSR